jgi:adenine phosphoribosyltransferase
MNQSLNLIKESIRTIPDWPKKGIMFRDITTLLENKEAFKLSIDLLYERYKDKNINYIVGIESRGFIFGSALAYKLNIGFIPIRKKGKLPYHVISEEYELEYGKDIMEMHKDVMFPNSNVILVDDLIATGGTALAACNLINKANANIFECCFIIDLPDLGGSKKIQDKNISVFSLIDFEGE